MFGKHGAGHVIFWLSWQIVGEAWGLLKEELEMMSINQTWAVEAYIKNEEKRRNRYEGKDKASWPKEALN